MHRKHRNAEVYDICIEVCNEFRDSAAAVFWYREAAKKGVPEAMYNLGMRCLEGIGVPKSRKEGLFWLRQAAKRKEPKARKVLRALGED